MRGHFNILPMRGPHLLQPVHLGFNPTRQDVQIALRILTGLQLRAFPGRLPAELALDILAHAEYNPRIGPQASVAGLYLTTSQALPSCFRRASSITLQMRSAGQCFATYGGGGTYGNSHTWFEVCILRRLPGAADPVPPGPGGDELQLQLPLELQVSLSFRSPGDANQELAQLGWEMVDHNGSNTWMVHHNSTASRDWANYRVDWQANAPTEIQVPGAVGDGEGFLAALKPGDKIALWARAEQQLWVIRVAEAMIEIVYEV